MISARWASCLLLLAIAAALHSSQHAKKTPAVTWSENIAPVVDHSCAQCHYPHGPAPFSLLTYPEMQSHALQVSMVTASRFMPPWLPAPNGLALQHDRRLTTAQIALFHQWAAHGAPEGDPRLAPVMPVPVQGWRLGAPSRILRMTQGYLLPGETTSPYRCFILPLDSAKPIWVHAVQFRPGNSKVVRHATVFADPSGIARKLQMESGTVGYTALNAGLGPHAERIASWAVGSSPFVLPSGTAEEIPAHADLILLLRFETDGQPEPVRSEVGLYDASHAPVASPATLTLGSRNLIVQAEQRGSVTASFRLPVTVRVLRLTPHGSPICQTLRVQAFPPTRPAVTLLQINDWNFDWQDSYQFASRLVLPAGTEVRMRWTVDNSGDNPRNPDSPSMTQLPGLEYLDEMATVRFQLLAVNPSQQNTLAEALSASMPPPEILFTLPGRHG